MKFFKTTAPRPDPATTARLDVATAPDAPAAPEARSGRGLRLGIKPARVTLGLPALRTTTTNGGPARPDVTGASRRSAEVPSKPMSAARNDAAIQRSRDGMSRLHPVTHPEAGLPTTPDTVAGMRSEAGFRDTVQAMFGNTAAAEGLSQLVLGAVPPASDGATPYAAPLVLATALRSVGVETEKDAENLLIASTRGHHLLRKVQVDDQGQATRVIVPMKRGEHFRPEHEQALFRLERVLAATVTGTQALSQLHHLEGQPQKLEAMRDGLALCSALQAKGVDLDRHSSADDVLRHLSTQPGTKMDAPIGRDDDAPLQLLSKALRHVQHVGQGVASKPDDRAAFTAWKQGGFVESGKGSDFHRTIERLHKFQTYVDRADHGPRTLGNLAHDARALLGRMVGVGKSPLTQTRHGTQGVDRGLLQHEVAKYQAGLNKALDTAVENLVDELRDPALQRPTAKRNKQLVQAAVLGLWRETGQGKIRVADVQARANALLAQVDPQAGGVAEAALRPHLRRLTRPAPSDDGAPAVQVGVAALEAAGAARRRGGPASAADAAGAAPRVDPDMIRHEIQHLRALPGNTPWKQEQLAALQAQRRETVTALLDEMRSVEQARNVDRPLFKFSDLKVLLRGAPREGPTAADAQALMKTVASRPYESTSTFADGASRGLGSFGVLLLGSGATLGTPLVYPVLQAESGKRATVSMGVSNTGARLYVGTDKSMSASVGVGAGWVTPPLAKNMVNAVALADATVSRGVNHGEGAVIKVRNDQPEWRDKLPQIVDYLFDQARLPQGDGPAHRAHDPGEFWQRFSDRFGDDPAVTVAWVNERSVSTAAQVSAVAVARVAAGPATSIGPAVSVGLRAQGSEFQRTPHADGAETPVTVRNRTVVASASAAMTQTLPAAVPGSTPPPPGQVGGWGSAAPWMGAAVEIDVAGSLGVARLGRTREGQVCASQCHREVLFQQPQRLIEYANLHRADWEAAIVAQDPNGTTTPEQARTRLNAFLKQMADLPATDAALHGELRSLARPVAEQINQLEARLTTLTGHGDKAAQARPLSAAERTECNAIENEVNRLLQAQESWEPTFMYAAEFNQTSSSTGLNFGVRAVNQEQSTVVRPTALIVASMAEV